MVLKKSDNNDNEFNFKKQALKKAHYEFILLYEWKLKICMIYVYSYLGAYL